MGIPGAFLGGNKLYRFRAISLLVDEFYQLR